MIDCEAPYVRHSSTSKAAARAIQPVAATYEAQVLDFIRSREARGATADECLEALALSHQNGSARVSTLAKREQIVRTSQRRKTRSGRTAYVYVAPEFAVEF